MPLLRRTALAVIATAAFACEQAPTADAPPSQAPAVPAETTGEDGTTPASPPDARPASDAAAPLSTGCGKAAGWAAGAVAARQVTAKGKARTFHVGLPAGYDASKPHAVVLVLHGATDTDPASMRDWFPVEAGVDGAIGVYPQALPRTHADGSGGNVTRWDVDGDEDLLFFDALLADVMATTCVDASRVFATGFSSGGNFAQQLGCLRASAVRAIAPVAGPGPFVDTCQGPKAVWMTHDVNDDALPIAGARASRDFWKSENGCHGTWQADAKLASCKQDVSCPADAPLVYCETKGVGHDVPDFAAAAIARFFTGFPARITP